MSIVDVYPHKAFSSARCVSKEMTSSKYFLRKTKVITFATLKVFLLWKLRFHVRK